MFEFRVTPDGGDEYELKATSRDIVQWETSGKGRSLKQVVENMAFRDLYAIAWQAAVRTGRFQGSDEDFRRTVDLDVLGDREAEADPTQPGR